MEEVDRKLDKYVHVRKQFPLRAAELEPWSWRMIERSTVRDKSGTSLA